MRDVQPRPGERPAAPAPLPERAPARVSLALDPATVLSLQRTAGNAAVSSLPARAPVTAERRYDFAVTVEGRPWQFRNLTPAQTVEELRALWRIIHSDLDEGRGENLKLRQRREEHHIAGFWSDLLGGTEVPDPGMWNAVGRGPLAKAMTVLESTDAALKEHWAAGEAAIDRNLPPGLERNPLMQEALAFDSVLDDMIKSAALSGLLTYAGHAMRGAPGTGTQAGRVKPKVKPPVIEESPPGGFEPTTREPVPEDDGPEPVVEDVVLAEMTPERETRNRGDPGKRKLHASAASAARSCTRSSASWTACSTGSRAISRSAACSHRRCSSSGINEFRNTPGLEPEAAIEEFRQTLADPRPLVDLSSAGDHHGSHIHAFQRYLGDRLFGSGEGLRFRQKLAELQEPSKTRRSGQADRYEKPFWSQVWDELFDASGNLHSPGVIGEILQDHLDFPRWNPDAPR